MSNRARYAALTSMWGTEEPQIEPEMYPYQRGAPFDTSMRYASNGVVLASSPCKCPDCQNDRRVRRDRRAYGPKR